MRKRRVVGRIYGMKYSPVQFLVFFSHLNEPGKAKMSQVDEFPAVRQLYMRFKTVSRSTCAGGSSDA